MSLTASGPGSGDRARRLCQALPRVSEAVRQRRVFVEDGGRIWNDLRRGIADVKRLIPRLDELASLSLDAIDGDNVVADTWEFILMLMADSPKYARQIMEVISILLDAPLWAQGFVGAARPGRLALWKLSLPPTSEGKESMSPLDPVALTVRLLGTGVSVDTLMPAAEVVAQAPLFLRALFAIAEKDAGVRGKLQTSALAAAWGDARRAAEQTRAATDGDTSVADVHSTPTSGGDASRPPSKNQWAHAANLAQVASIEAAADKGKDRRPACRKDVVDSLLDVTSEAVEHAARRLQPLLTGYAGEANIATSAKSKILEFRRRQSNLQAQLLVLGPCQAGKTSLVYSLVGFAALPPESPTVITTRWIHTPNLAIPRLTMPQALAELLDHWADAACRAQGDRSEHEHEKIKILAPNSLGTPIEGVASVADALERAQGTVHLGRLLGIIGPEDLGKLLKPCMSMTVEVAFSALSNLDKTLADTGTLSLVDLPSPDLGDLLAKSGNMVDMCRRALREADGVIVVVDASKYEAPRWFADLLHEAFVEERLLRKQDAWIVANRIDQIPEFCCEGGIAEVCSRVKAQQYRNYRDIIVSEDHIIPTAAWFSLLGTYGMQQIVAHRIESDVLAGVARQKWFAQVCSFLFGYHWFAQVRGMERRRWQQSMRELQLLGQVTGPLAQKVLETAYAKMLPRSAARVLFDLSQLITHFVASLQSLECGSTEIDVARLRTTCEYYYDDVEKKVHECMHANLATEEDSLAFALAKCQAPIMFDDSEEAESAELTEDYFLNLARDALNLWHTSYCTAVAQSAEKVLRLHPKFQRSIDHWLTQGRVDVITKQRVLLDTKTLSDESFDCGGSGDKPDEARTLPHPLPASQRDRLVREHVRRVPCTRVKQLFQRTRRSFHVTPEAVQRFLVALHGAWFGAAFAEASERCLAPLEKHFDELVQHVEDLNAEGRVAVKGRDSFDFSFVRLFEELLPQVGSFDKKVQEDGDAHEMEADEVERCEAFCEAVHAALSSVANVPPPPEALSKDHAGKVCGAVEGSRPPRRWWIV